MSSELFPDNERPLYTPDTSLQRQIVERIAKAKEGPQVHKKGGKSNPEDAPRGLRMGQHPQVSNEKLGYAWGMTRQTAGKLIQHPEDMTPYQVDEMCDVLGVTLAWLRGTELVNAYGVYEESDIVADLYDTLTPEDKALICNVLTRIAGNEAVQGVRAERRIRRNETWYNLHKDEADQIRQRTVGARHVAEVLGLLGHPDIDLFLRLLPEPKQDR